MCVTFGKANLSSTIVFASDALVNGRLIHLLGYQNTFENHERGGNAMALPFPTSAAMSEANVLDTSEAPDLLEALARLAVPEVRSKGLARGGAMPRGGYVHVFDSGRYTIVLAENAFDVIPALDRVPAHKRPRASGAMVGAYAEFYPGQPLALCCFDGSSRSEPLLFWYEPSNPDYLFLPGLDAHDGGAPDLSAYVEVDHKLVYGLGASSTAGADGASTADLRARLPGHLQALVPPTAYGYRAEGSANNGDWRVSKRALAAEGYRARPQRVSPPGA